ncbi:FtsX-like permease family protein [Leucobacter aridicollis]|uniref:FtsX-like permease family protein n=1 Tax=Leucobacter aridicollis TaxID=283878 RepID=UPI0021686FD4|nr:FtsX-like permease family protein [Leucobacter aridicollis]MCS3427454.1 putative membrane protein [Leucobacter aridicollis]
MTTHAFLILARPAGRSGTIAAMQLAAAALTTILTFAVALLARAYWSVPSPEPGYPILAVGLAGALLVPLITLGGSTARLAARSRDDRLATLRLLGASAGTVRRLAVAEATLTAAAGVAVGTALSVALPTALGGLTVHGSPLREAAFHLPWWVTAALPPALIAVAAMSALLGLRRVTLSPLGVRARQDAPRLSWLRAVAGVAVVVATVVLVQISSPGWGTAALVAAFALATLALTAVLGLVGPLAVGVTARVTAARTADASTLVAARGVADDPRSAWRSVSTLALASFVLLPAGSLLGYLDTISRSESRAIMTTDQLLLFADTRTMLLALTAVSFVVVSCQIAITQTAAILERRDLYIALDRLGMPRTALERARRVRVLRPALIAVGGSAAVASIVAAPLVFVAATVAPFFLVSAVAILGVGLLLVWAGVAATRPVLSRTLTAPSRGE